MSKKLQALMREILDDNYKALKKTLSPSKKKIIELAGNRNQIICLQDQLAINRQDVLKSALYHGMTGLCIPLVLWVALFISQFHLHLENLETLRHLFAFSWLIAFANVVWNASIMSTHSKPNYPDGYAPIKPT